MHALSSNCSPRVRVRVRVRERVSVCGMCAACMGLVYCRLWVGVGAGGLLGAPTRLVGPVQCGWVSSADGGRSGPLVGA